MNHVRLGVSGALVLLLLGGFFFFPGHTFLTADTQIYLPILEHLRDPALFAKDPVATRPHVTYTIYDETALLWRRLTGQPFQAGLVAQQLATRLCGLVGMFLVARACSLAIPWALLVASIYGLGTLIGGPSVLIIEYEPVPRGYAGPLLVLSMGLAAREFWTWSGVAAGVAILYHPPTAIPVLVAGSLVLALMRRDALLHLAAPIAAAIALTWLLSRLQAGATERQVFFGAIDAGLEKLQRLRGSYNWVSIWAAPWIRHWELMGALCGLSLWKLRAVLPPLLRRGFAALTVYSLLMIPLSYLLLEQLKWSLMPQLQPARALLFVALILLVTAAMNGLRAARDNHPVESLAWFFLAYAIPAAADTLTVILPELRDPASRWRTGSVLLLALLAWSAARWERTRPLLSRVALGAALCAPFLAYTKVGGVKNYAIIDHSEMDGLVQWARANTAPDDVFLFPDAATALYPGLFRVNALRTVYVDWKGGGQVNLLKEFATEWWTRWEATGGGKFDPALMPRFTSLGIRYVVVTPGRRLDGRPAVFENSRYVVYRTD